MHFLLGATLIDGTGAPPVLDSAVVIDGQRIMAAGARGDTLWPARAEVIDLSGLTLLPGLIDTHDHLASHGYALTKRWGLDEPASTAHLRTGGVLEQTLAMGYTTVRDAGGLDAGFKLAVEEGLVDGPRLSLGTEDHLAHRGNRRQRQSVGAYLLATTGSVVAGQCREWDRSGAYGGADHGAGRGRRDQVRHHRWRQLAPRPWPDRRRLHPRRDAGPRRGGACARSESHVSYGVATKASGIEAGVDSIEHGCYLTEEPELIAMMAERGIYLTPTLLVYVYHRESTAPHVQSRRARDLYARHLDTVRMALDRRGEDHGRRPTPAGTTIRSMPASSSAWWRLGCRRCRRSRPLRDWPPRAWDGSARVGTVAGGPARRPGGGRG